jgi:hypothetical protein
LQSPSRNPAEIGGEPIHVADLQHFVSDQDVAATKEHRNVTFNLIEGVGGPKIGLQLRPAIDERPFLYVSEKHPPHDGVYAPEVVRNGGPHCIREGINAALKDFADAALPIQQAFR